MMALLCAALIVSGEAEEDAVLQEYAVVTERLDRAE
jgi:hypothetical protein